jgi:hypothetical protein
VPRRRCGYRKSCHPLRSHWPLLPAPSSPGTLNKCRASPADPPATCNGRSVFIFSSLWNVPEDGTLRLVLARWTN